jgi:uncharacterized protein YceH (UPF0502 family)
MQKPKSNGRNLRAYLPPRSAGDYHVGMISLNADESRVLGVLIEKTTTPEQYPLSLNAIVNGANQKNNRDPVRAMAEDECFEATESLRAKGLVEYSRRMS